MSEANIVDRAARGSCWSITINNPKDSDYNMVLPSSWYLEGQLEKGDETGTLHYQGMLRTPQVRWSAVKKVFPRAHVEPARNPIALKKYVHKEETRVAAVAAIPTLFEYQTIIAEKWVEDEFKARIQRYVEANQIPDIDVVALRYIDSLVAADVESGRRGAEYIAINPMWRSSWKYFWRSIINRHVRSPSPPCSPENAAPSSPCDGTLPEDAP